MNILNSAVQFPCLFFLSGFTGHLQTLRITIRGKWMVTWSRGIVFIKCNSIVFSRNSFKLTFGKRVNTRKGVFQLILGICIEIWKNKMLDSVELGFCTYYTVNLCDKSFIKALLWSEIYSWTAIQFWVSSLCALYSESYCKTFAFYI